MENSDLKMRDYYRLRAPHYEKVYDYPERQQDLRFLEEFIPQQFQNLRVLEIAAGTGYWSQFIVRKAQFLLATDAEAETLAQLGDHLAFEQEDRGNGEANIETRVADAYRLANIDEKFDALFAGQWFSHIPIERRKAFIKTIHGKLMPGATVIFLDNSTAQLDRLPLNGIDNEGNTFQDRKLENGSAHRVLKNFPKKTELEALVRHCSSDMVYQELENYWMFQYTYQPISG